MTVSFPVWAFYLFGIVGAIVSVGLISWAVMRVERWLSKRNEAKFLNGQNKTPN